MSGAQPYRLRDGGRIDRSRPLAFTFNGKRYNGYAGDTLASALLANGVRIVSRSLKFHRPRGVLSAGIEEPNALVRADCGSGMLPNVCATTLPLTEGLRAESQNCFPSVGFDLGRVLDFTRSLWPAGFYHKVFKWPHWHAFEWAIRRIAGPGWLPDGEHPMHCHHVNAHCDLLVVGTGPAGLSAALEAARRGEDVLLADQDAEPGGSLLHASTEIDGEPSAEWLAATVGELRAMENVRLLVQATAVGYYDHDVVTLHDCSAAYSTDRPVEVLWKVRAGRVVLATGATEQPLLFGANDLPGVMLAGALHRYAGRYAVNCGKRIVGLVNHDLAWRSLLASRDLGVGVTAIMDTRGTVREDLLAAAVERNIAVHTGVTPFCARGSAAVKALAFEGDDGRARDEPCDVIAMSGGLNPNVHLYSQAGGRLCYSEALACFVPHACRQNVTVTGAANGAFAASGTYAIGARGPAPVRPDLQWIDYLNDVTVSDIELAVRENYASVELLKRYTTVGMGMDQGKTGNLNALILLGRLTGRPPGRVGTTTFRPMFRPVTMAAFAGNCRGELYRPVRRLPAHDWHAAQGATFDEYGDCLRPAWYGSGGAACIEREVRHVRTAAGLLDSSTIGKIEVKGPGAAAFLERIYANPVATLAPGRARYGVMLNENGIVIEDGIVVRLADDHFLLNTTSGGAGRVATWLEEWRQCEHAHLEVVTMDVTSQWGIATVAGPRSGAILEGLLPDTNLSTGAFPHMSFASGRLPDGTPYRVQRVSFSGERSYEIAVPASGMASLLDRLIAIGAAHHLRPFGLEALMVLRLEKGFLHVGVDTDGSTNALDIGLGRVIARKEADFVGARSLARPADRRRDRRQLVGFELEGGDGSVPAGAHFVSEADAGRRSEGYVTSMCESPTLGRTIGLGLLERGAERHGEQVSLYDDGRVLTGRVVPLPFYDPAGSRMRA